jgi:hypothetical protein
VAATSSSFTIPLIRPLTAGLVVPALADIVTQMVERLAVET